MQLKRKWIEILKRLQILSYLNSKYLRFVSLQGASRDAGRDVSKIAIKLYHNVKVTLFHALKADILTLFTLHPNVNIVFLYSLYINNT
jgi:hypothetical protein